MITYQELREISLNFRRLSSNLLTATIDNADALLQRFKNYIDGTAFISNSIQSFINDIDYDYNECFVSNDGGSWRKIRIPIDEPCHIKAMYDYMTEIVTSEVSVYSVSASYHYGSRKINDNIQSFLDEAFKPMIDFINDLISKEMILQEEARRLNTGAITQNIGTVYGSVNQQGSGSIVSHNTTNVSVVGNIVDSIRDIIENLSALQGVGDEELDDVRDDLESIAEQLCSDNPRKNRIQKALTGIKKFVDDILSKATVTYVTETISEADWSRLIQQIDTFLETLS